MTPSISFSDLSSFLFYYFLTGGTREKSPSMYSTSTVLHREPLPPVTRSGSALRLVAGICEGFIMRYGLGLGGRRRVSKLGGPDHVSSAGEALNGLALAPPAKPHVRISGQPGLTGTANRRRGYKFKDKRKMDHRKGTIVPLINTRYRQACRAALVVMRCIDGIRPTRSCHSTLITEMACQYP